jgi:5-methylcytosine-specific restriction protein A
MRPFARQFYNSKRWEQARALKIKQVFGLCERCANAGLIVHHRTHLTPENINDPAITLALDQLELLCLDCHNEEHMPSASVAEGLRFDECGNIMQKKPL